MTGGRAPGETSVSPQIEKEGSHSVYTKSVDLNRIISPTILRPKSMLVLLLLHLLFGPELLLTGGSRAFL